MRYDPPTSKFPYKISKRLNLLSIPRKYIVYDGTGMPEYTPRGIRLSALRGHASDRIIESSYPYVRMLILTKRKYKNQFSQERLERIDHMIDLTSGTCYSKLAHGTPGFKKNEVKVDVKKKRGWSETDRKKHIDYIGQISGPKRVFNEPPIERGPRKPLGDLLPRIEEISYLPEFKVYRRLSKEKFYRDPVKVSPKALQYQISERVKKLAVARVIPTSY